MVKADTLTLKLTTKNLIFDPKIAKQFSYKGIGNEASYVTRQLARYYQSKIGECVMCDEFDEMLIGKAVLYFKYH